MRSRRCFRGVAANGARGPGCQSAVPQTPVFPPAPSPGGYPPSLPSPGGPAPPGSAATARQSQLRISPARFGASWPPCPAPLFAAPFTDKKLGVRKKGDGGSPTPSPTQTSAIPGHAVLPKSHRGAKRGREEGRKTWLTGITDGRMQQIHARGCETQAIDCIRWLLKIRHHAKVVAGRRVGRNPGEGEPAERPACPGRCLGEPSGVGGAARCLRRRERREQCRDEGGVRPDRCPPPHPPQLLSPFPSPPHPSILPLGPQQDLGAGRD